MDDTKNVNLRRFFAEGLSWPQSKKSLSTCRLRGILHFVQDDYYRMRLPFFYAKNEHQPGGLVLIRPIDNWTCQ